MSDAPALPRRSKRAAREPSADEVRELILAKVQAAGAGGAPSLHGAKVSDTVRALFVAAVESLEAAEQVFVDRRKAKPRFYAWAVRPVFPSAESVAEELLAFAATRFPVLTGAADFKKLLAKDKEKAAVQADAIARLVEQKRLLAFTHAGGKKQTPLYVAATSVRELLGGETPLPADIPAAYAELVRRTGFPAVMLSELQRESGVDLPTLHRWARGEHQAGRVVLSLGDWSLASAAQRAAVLEIYGERYLQVRLLE
ncbi:MAG TPA: hypothetical protein VGO11_08395 [Chthoniobacteraceae bacterium]|nr:hypothetical protein [Chthoniobacteraceae bacterium]